MNNPLVSVIIPAFKCESTIAQAIDSALNQEIDVEIIVINDQSPDNVDEVMQLYSRNPAVTYLKNEANLGAAETRNKGVKAAKGEYIAFLDADDIWQKGKLKAQLELIESWGAVLCATARELMTPDGVLTGRVIPVKTEITYKDLLKQNSINCSSVVIKRDVALEFPMHHAEDSHEDYIMWLEVLGKYKKACAVNKPLLKYRLSNTGKSGSKLHSAKMTFNVYRYVGFSLPKSIICFISYAFCGVKKYLFGV